MEWLRSIFKTTKKEEPAEEIPEEELLEWFLERSDAVISDIQQDIREKLDQLEEEIDAVNAALDTLAEAKLQNENISEKARAIMQGNRAAYVKFVRMFITTLDVPSEITHENMQVFISSFEDKLDTMHKSTAKSFYILQEFFAHESSEVAKHLKTMDSIIRSLLHNKFSGMLALKKRIKELDAQRKSSKDLARNIADEEQEASVTMNLINDTDRHIKKVKQSAAWWDLDKLRKEQQTAHQKIRNVENHLHGKLTSVDRVLKKYAWLVPEHKELVEKYLESPMVALLDDPSLTIILILQRAEQLVQENQIELKEKEKEKMIQKLRELTSENLRDALAQHGALKDSLDELERRIRGNGVMRELEELEYKLAHLQEKYARIEENREKLEKQRAKMDVEKAKSGIQSEIREVLGVAVLIT